MSNILKTNNPSNYLIIFIIGIIVWLPGFFAIPEIEIISKHYSLLFKSLNINSLDIYVNKAIAFAIVYILSVYLIHINQKLAIINGSYQLPGVLLITLSGLSFSCQQITPGLISTLLIVLATKRIIDTYQKSNVLANCFDAGFFVALASLIHTQAITYTIFLMLAILIIRPFKIREYLTIFIGIATPILLFIAVLFLFDKEQLFFNNFNRFFPIKYYPEKFNFINIISYIPIVLLGYFSLLFMASESSLKKNVTRKQLSVISIFFILSSINLIIPINSFINEFFTLLIPISLILSFFMVNNKSRIMRKFISYLLIINVIASQIIQMFNYLNIEF